MASLAAVTLAIIVSGCVVAPHVGDPVDPVVESASPSAMESPTDWESKYREYSADELEEEYSKVLDEYALRLKSVALRLVSEGRGVPLNSAKDGVSLISPGGVCARGVAIALETPNGLVGLWLDVTELNSTAEQVEQMDWLRIHSAARQPR